MRILAVDPGEKRIGLAVSDPTLTIASPLTIIPHKSRRKDAATIVNLAQENGAAFVLVGQALDSNGQPTYQSKRAKRLAEEIQTQSDLQVELWDESGSTSEVRETQIELNVSRRRRRSPVDHLAAAYILQTYLDARAIDRQADQL